MKPWHNYHCTLWKLLNATKTRVSCITPEAFFPIAAALSHKPYAMNAILRYCV
jgi:hypothetical protein